MDRVYFDGNETEENDHYGLWLSKSMRDLAKIAGGPREGMLVTIYMVGEIEMEATLEWNAKLRAWTAKPILGSIRENTETWEDAEHR